MMLLAISKNGYNFALASLAVIILFNIVAAKPASDIVSSTEKPASDNVTSTEKPASDNVTSTEKPPETPTSCEQAKAQDVNVAEFLGVWFEAARKTNGPTNETCNAWNFVNENNNTYVNATYNMNSSPVSEARVNISLSRGSYKTSLNGTDIIYKILQTDYKTFAYICSYRVDTNPQKPTLAPPAQPASTALPTTPEQPSPSSPSSPPASPQQTATPALPASPELSSTTTALPEQPSPSSTPASPEKPVHNLINAPDDAFFLVRSRTLTTKHLEDLMTQAKKDFPFFRDLTIVSQSNCTGADNVVAGASTLVPMLTMMITVAVATVLKF